MTQSKLVYVVLYPDQRLQVVVDAPDGKRRRVEITWKSLEPMPIPKNWLEMVEEELRFQDAEALNRARGRVLL